MNPGSTPAASIASLPRLGWQNSAVNRSLQATCSQYNLPVTRSPDSSTCSTSASRNIPFTFIDGGAGDDELSAFAGRDTLLGGDGNDHLTAVGDLAQLDGGPGADTLITLEGDNTLFTDDGFPDTVHGGGFERVDADPLDELIDVELAT